MSQRVMQGHAGANLTPLVCANRIGPEGEIVAKASEDKAEVITASFDLAVLRERRAEWGVFRDRRPEAYGALMTLDGVTPAPR